MNQDFYKNNRKKLFGFMEPNSAALLFSGQAPVKTADEMYPYAPNRNFLYMTGIAEENLILYLEKGEVEEATLFIARFDELKAKWVGTTISEEDAKTISGVENIRFLDEFENFLHKKIQAGVTKLYFDLERPGKDSVYGPGGQLAVKLRSQYPQVEVRDAYEAICSFRLIKDEAEIEEMKKAIRITSEGIKNLMKNRRADAYEYEMEAEFDYVLKKSGVKDFAFKTICAAGKNAAVLHYVDNDQKIGPEDLLLLDLGAQWNYYSADISRTFPINGKFSPRQRQLYDIVILAMDRVFEAIKPGVPFKRLNEIVRETYAEELKKIGLIQDAAEVTKYYFHGVSHYLGLDTHDVGSREVNLEPGMVLTVEPGLYLAEEGIGIRVEDDILVTATGSENLVTDLPRTAQEIEDFLAQ